MACGQSRDVQSLNVEQAAGQGIVNGTAVEESDVVSRSTAALYLKFPQSERVSQFCTATLIGKRVLSTAAHCLLAVSQGTGLEVSELIPHLRVAFGLKRTEVLDGANVTFITVKQAVVHPDFKLDALETANETTAIPDIALLQLSQDAPSGYVPATLLRDEAQLIEGTSLILAGYGLTAAQPVAVAATELRRADVRVLTAKFNPTQFSYLVTEGKSACSGDSGGPAFLASSVGSGLVLAGVTSFGDRGCESLGVYTSIPALVKWIDQEVANFDQQTQPAMVAQASAI